MRYLRCVIIALLVAAVSSISPGQRARSSARIAVFFEQGFPETEGLGVTRAKLLAGLKPFESQFLTSSQLNLRLNPFDFDLLITPYGSAFPKESEIAILKFLRGGGNWVNLGGTPLSVPVVNDGSGWKSEPRQSQFHKKLGLTQSFGVSTRIVKSYVGNEAIDGSEAVLSEFSADEVFECYYRFTNTRDFPAEDGSSGQRDAQLEAVLWGLDSAGQKLVAPFVQIDRLQGEFAGGRWIFANYRGKITDRGIRWMVNEALHGASKFTVRPTLACYRDGEVPAFDLRLQLHSPGISVVGTGRLTVVDAMNLVVETITVPLAGTNLLRTGSAVSTKRAWKPGLYRVTAKLDVRDERTGHSISLRSQNGFWMYDEALISSGSALTVGEREFFRDGSVYPITGTTYMASDVARKFLLEPNAAVWDQDFKEMKESGINIVRTGLWNSYKNYSLDVGAPNEQFLRSLDAFILTARKYDIPTVFTFFAFLPESWGGENAYLDPRSVSAQKQFLATVAQRYAHVSDIAWDLINEPSFCNPNNLWSCRPNYDQFESRAWEEWIRNRYAAGTGSTWQNTVRLNFRMSAEEPISLPSMEDFQDVNIFDQRRPYKVVDYRLFAQDMFGRWVAEMKSALRSNGNVRQLVTVGQDEGGTGDSPNNQLAAEDLDFTSMHNWWLNDDLVWDNVITRAPGKPNLLEETGVMFYEQGDGSAWRSEQEAANLLERKLAVALGAGGAGFIEWIWNINPYMKSDNEATIGLHRVDGTIKPELHVLQTYARFFRQNASLMKNREESDVLLVIPHGTMFSTRNSATEATKKSVHTLAYRFGIIPQSVSEFRLDRVVRKPTTIILPSPQSLSQAAWVRLLKLVEAGSTLLLSGPVERDEHGFIVGRAADLGIEASLESIAQNESSVIGGTTYAAQFRQLKIQRVEKLRDGRGASVLTIPHGRGKIVWSLLPLELAEEGEGLTAFYRLGLEIAGSPVVPRTLEGEAVLRTVTNFDSCALVICVSEGSLAVRLVISEVLHLSNPTSTLTPEFEIPAQRTAVLFVDRRSGAVVARIP